MKKKKAFSLLEIMICIAILAIAGAAVSIGTFKLINYHKYRAELDEFVQVVSELQKMAVLHNRQFGLKIQNDPKGIIVSIENPEKIPLAIAKFHKQYHFLSAAYASLKTKEPLNKTFYFLPSKKITPEFKIFFLSEKLSHIQEVKMEEGKFIQVRRGK